MPAVRYSIYVLGPEALAWTIALRSPEPVGNAVPVRRTGSPYGINRLECRRNATTGVQSG
jgi:hypothetical protein